MNDVSKLYLPNLFQTVYLNYRVTDRYNFIAHLAEAEIKKNIGWATN